MTEESQEDQAAAKVVKVTRILKVRGLNAGKLVRLESTAQESARLRDDLWRRFSGARHASIGKLDLRRQLAAEPEHKLGARARYDLPQRIWRATVEGTYDEIFAWRRAATTELRRKIHARTEGIADKTRRDRERKRLYTLLKFGRWHRDPWLHRHARKAMPRARSHGRLRITLDGCSHEARRDERGQVWDAVMTDAGRIRLPLGDLSEHLIPAGAIDIILDGPAVTIHAAFPEERVCASREARPCGTEELGIDQGVTELFVDSAGRNYGEEHGDALRELCDRDLKLGRRRSKIRAVKRRLEKKAEVHAAEGRRREAASARQKASRIEASMLGTAKLDRRREHARAVARDRAFQAAHELVDHAGLIACEDLTRMGGKSPYGKTMTRRFSRWQRSAVAEAVKSVSRRRGSALALVNPAYTSQRVYACGHLGVRQGQSVHCEKSGCSSAGTHYDADINAALNIKERAADPTITRYLPKEKVKLIVESATVENCPTRTRVAEVALRPRINRERNSQLRSRSS